MICWPIIDSCKLARRLDARARVTVALAVAISLLGCVGCGSGAGKGSGEAADGDPTSGGNGGDGGDGDGGDGDGTGGDGDGTGGDGGGTGGDGDGSGPVETLAPRDGAKVYWVGHSLISAQDWNHDGALPLHDLLGTLASGAGQSYDYHKHTIPGAPLYWNWGINDQAWGDAEALFPPLIDPEHGSYGSFDVIVVTESVPVTLVYDFQRSGFYARRFFCAARRANPNVEFYLYESWPHFQAGDPEYAPIYGPRESFDFVEFLRGEHSIWEAIADDASDPSRRPAVPEDYSWRGPGDDPGGCEGVLPVHMIPSGAALVALIERMRERRAGDDWSYAAALRGGALTEIDLFMNPLTNFPADLSTTAFGGPIDDIHPSQVLAYYNAIVHYATVYRRDPVSVPAANGVPDNIAAIMKEVAWQVVVSDPRTGVTP